MLFHLVFCFYLFVLCSGGHHKCRGLGWYLRSLKCLVWWGRSDVSVLTTTVQYCLSPAVLRSSQDYDTHWCLWSLEMTGFNLRAYDMLPLICWYLISLPNPISSSFLIISSIASYFITCSTKSKWSDSAILFILKKLFKIILSEFLFNLYLGEKKPVTHLGFSLLITLATNSFV